MAERNASTGLGGRMTVWATSNPISAPAMAPIASTGPNGQGFQFRKLVWLVAKATLTG